MAAETTPATGVPQGPVTPESLIVANLDRWEAEADEREQEEEGDEPQPVAADQADGQAEGLTPEDVPDAPVPQPSADAFEIVHNGQQHKLTREETIRLAQQGFDYTQKTQALAEQHRGLEQRLAAVSQMEQLAPQLQQDAAQITALSQHLQQFQGVNWVQVAQDPNANYPLLRAQYDNLVSAYQQAVGQYQQKRAAFEQQGKQVQREVLAQQGQRLRDLIPAWRDSATYEKEAGEVAQYLRSKGYSPQVIDNLADATSVELAYKAMQYDKLVQAKAGKVKQLRQAPPVTRPGATQPPGALQTDRSKQLMGQLKRSGRMEDAAAVLLNGIE